MPVWSVLVAGVAGFGALGGVAACGGDRDRPGDAGFDAPALDAAQPDAGPPPCSYTERSDATNDPTAEPTGLTVGSSPQTLCGKINTGHFSDATTTVDSDGYRVTSDGGNLIVRFFGSPGPAALVELSVFVFNTDVNPTLLSGGSNNPIVRDHGAFLIALPAGTYDIVVNVRNPADLAAAFDYKVQLAPDGPGRCAAVTAPAAYTEVADGTGAGNDVIAVSFGVDPPFQLTASTADAAEPTGLTIDGRAPVRITGSSADENAADDYMDRDTYLVRTAAATTELTLRLGWAAATTDLQYIVFPADQTQPIGDSFRRVGNDKVNVIAVNPGSAYWIWIGSHDDSTGLPAAYDLTICGADLAP